MAKRFPTTAVGVALILAASAAHAQTPSLRAEHFYVIGGGGTGGYPTVESGGSEFHGPMAAATVGVPLFRYFAVEAAVQQVNYARNDWSNWKGHATGALVRGTFRFRPGAAARPYVAGIAGYVSDAWSYPSSWTDPNSRITSQREEMFVQGVAGGVDLAVRSRFFVRPEFSFLLGYYEAYVHTTIGVGVRF